MTWPDLTLKSAFGLTLLAGMSCGGFVAWVRSSRKASGTVPLGLFCGGLAAMLVFGGLFVFDAIFHFLLPLSPADILVTCLGLLLLLTLIGLFT